VYRDPKKHELLEYQMANSEQSPAKKGKKAILNHDFLTNEYQQAMMAALCLAPGLVKKPMEVLHLGTGAGIMPMFLNQQFGDNISKITTLDNNEAMLKVAEKYFGFQPTGRIESLCEDAHAFVGSCKSKYDLIIMDINYTEEDKNISPPWKFLEVDFLQRLVDLGSEHCLVALNVLYYSKDAKKKVFDNINAIEGTDQKAIFESSDNNKVFFLAKGATITLQDCPENTKALEGMLKAWNN
jgi:spermidine synthase